MMTVHRTEHTAMSQSGNNSKELYTDSQIKVILPLMLLYGITKYWPSKTGVYLPEVTIDTGLTVFNCMQPVSQTMFLRLTAFSLTV